MNINLLFILIVALALLTGGALTIQAGNATPAVVSNVRDLSDYAPPFGTYKSAEWNRSFRLVRAASGLLHPRAWR